MAHKLFLQCSVLFRAKLCRIEVQWCSGTRASQRSWVRIPALGLFYSVATLDKLFTHVASQTSDLQETGVQKGVYRLDHWIDLTRAYSNRAVQPICAVQNSDCAVQDAKLCSPKFA